MSIESVMPSNYLILCGPLSLPPSIFPSIRVLSSESVLRIRWSNQSILKKISLECSLAGLILKLKRQYFDHLMRRTDSLEKILILGKIEGERRKGQQRMRWYHWRNGHEFEHAPGVGDGQRGLVCCSPWGHKEADTTEWLNWLVDALIEKPVGFTARSNTILKFPHLYAVKECRNDNLQICAKIRLSTKQL